MTDLMDTLPPFFQLNVGAAKEERWTKFTQRLSLPVLAWCLKVKALWEPAVCSRYNTFFCAGGN